MDHPFKLLKIGNIQSYPVIYPTQTLLSGEWPSSLKFVHYIASCLLPGQANTGIALVHATPKFQNRGSMKSEADDFCCLEKLFRVILMIRGRVASSFSQGAASTWSYATLHDTLAAICIYYTYLRIHTYIYVYM